MNQEKIGKFIKEIRKSHNLTQKQFAKQFGVTYQAVSKWENGKNVPDIEILKMLCETYNKDINEFLTGKNKKKSKLPLIILLIVMIFMIVFLVTKNDNFEFKTITAKCDKFTITGSIAYNNNKSSIYISNIKYCNKDDDDYKKIECSLYEKNKEKEKEIGRYIYNKNKAIKLEDFFKNVTFNIDNYNRICKNYSKDSLYLMVKATKEDDKIITHKIPLSLKNNCPR